MSVPGYEAERDFIEKCRRGGRILCEHCGRQCKANPSGLCYYCRTGRAAPTIWVECDVCGRRCIYRSDGLCGECRKGRKAAAPVDWDSCSHCGRRCRHHDSGLCSACRRLTPEGRQRHNKYMKSYRLNQNQKQREAE